MAETDARTEATLANAERVVAEAGRLGISAAVIGALALAVHGYPRATRDLDLAVYVDPFSTFRELADQLRELGWTVELVLPDAEDPLGGVITITGDGFDPIQIVNFCNTLTSSDNPGYDAIESARHRLDSTALPVVDLPHLIALKLYAGGAKSKLDVLELIERNPSASIAEIRDVCQKYGLAASLGALLDATA